MSGNIEDDLFYDLFGEEGFLTPESTGSTDQDSGHGSPFESNFDTSPRPSFGWETTDHVGEFWGSILDDLPSDITDDSDSNDYKSPLSSSNDQDEPSVWSTKILEESAFDCNSNTMNVDDDWSFNGNVYSNIKDTINTICAPVNNNDNTNNSFPINIPETKSELHSAISDNILTRSEIHFQPTPPIVIKPSTVRKGPTWVVKTSDIKSHFQIGQNIVAIIQSVNSNSTGEKASVGVDYVCNESTKNTEMHPVTPTDDQGGMIYDQGTTVTHMRHSDHDYADTEIPQLRETTGVSKGMGPGLILTDEEKKLLEMESLNLPEDAPLTKEEEKVLKKVRRKIKNKQSAMESRRKRKEYIENLERRVKHCTDLNHGLRKKVDKLTKENKSMVNQLKTMKEFIAASFQQTRTSGTGTCVAVLLFSFALFILPFNPFLYEGRSDNTIPTETPATAMFRSRTLLGIEDNTDYVYHDNELNNSYSISYDSYLNEPSVYTETVKIHFGSVGNYLENDYILKANISMYMQQNLTWHSQLNDKQTDHYVNS